jgi:hypothetical protein
MIKNKKALSNVIATVVLVLLVVVAISIIATFVIDFARQGLDESSECLPYKEYLEFDEQAFKDDVGEEYKFNCGFEDGDDFYSVLSIRAKVLEEEEVNGINAVFIKEGLSKPMNVINGVAKTNEVRMWDESLTELKIPNGGETQTYLFKLGENFEKAEIHVILESGGACEKSDSIKLRECEDNIKSEVLP